MGARGKQCSICASPDLSLKCDGLLASGLSLIEIAAQLGVSKYTVSRHGRHSMLKLSDTEAEKLPANRLDQLYDRCESLYSALAGNGDVKAAADVLKVQTRLAESAVAREERKQRDASTDDNEKNAAVVRDWCDKLIKVVDENQQKHFARGRILCPLCGGSTLTMTPNFVRNKLPELLTTFGEPENNSNVNVV